MVSLHQCVVKYFYKLADCSTNSAAEFRLQMHPMTSRNLRKNDVYTIFQISKVSNPVFPAAAMPDFGYTYQNDLRRRSAYALQDDIKRQTRVEKVDQHFEAADDNQRARWKQIVKDIPNTNVALNR